MSGDRAFQRLRKGQSGGSKHVTIRWRPNVHGEVRVGLVVSRKVGKAVVRNRVRRRLREAVRETLDGGLADSAYLASRPSIDLLIIARPSAATIDYHELKRSLRSALARASLTA